MAGDSFSPYPLLVLKQHQACFFRFFTLQSRHDILWGPMVPELVLLEDSKMES